MVCNQMLTKFFPLKCGLSNIVFSALSKMSMWVITHWWKPINTSFAPSFRIYLPLFWDQLKCCHLNGLSSRLAYRFVWWLFWKSQMNHALQSEYEYDGSFFSLSFEIEIVWVVKNHRIDRVMVVYYLYTSSHIWRSVRNVAIDLCL